MEEADKRDLFERVGYYDLSYKVSADWVFWIKAIVENQCTVRLFNKKISYMEEGGVSSNMDKCYYDMSRYMEECLKKGTITWDNIFTYSLRYIFIKVFVLITPFAFLSLILSNTSWFFKAWLKNLFSLLFIQIIVSIILLLMFSVDFSNTDLFSKFIYVGGMYGLIRANSLVRDFIGGVSTTVAQSVKSFTNLK